MLYGRCTFTIDISEHRRDIVALFSERGLDEKKAIMKNRMTHGGRVEKIMAVFLSVLLMFPQGGTSALDGVSSTVMGSGDTAQESLATNTGDATAADDSAAKEDAAGVAIPSDDASLVNAVAATNKQTLVAAVENNSKNASITLEGVLPVGRYVTANQVSVYGPVLPDGESVVTAYDITIYTANARSTRSMRPSRSL